jgi:hypothetical protein
MILTIDAQKLTRVTEKGDRKRYKNSTFALQTPLGKSGIGIAWDRTCLAFVVHGIELPVPRFLRRRLIPGAGIFVCPKARILRIGGIGEVRFT